VNSSGDLIIVDPKGSWKIKEEDLYATYPITPFIGWELRGKIKYTILKGKIIYDENQPIGPTGNFIRKGFLTSSDLKY